MKKELAIINPNAAGIDIGSEFHYVCVPEGRDKTRIRKFNCYTGDLHRLANWLEECKVDTIALESTGVYWIPVFDILESRGFKVILVNAKYVKNVPGRKTDVKDSEWLQQLHSYGLLQGSFRPEEDIRVLRGYTRQRDNLVKSSSTHVQRMQKALIQMNIQLHKVISDITGETGVKIIEAILNGERNAHKLAELRSNKIKNTEDTIAASLQGNYREEHIFSLKQEYEAYKFYQQQIYECDEKIKQYFNEHGNENNDDTKKNNLSDELHKLAGVDLTKIPGLGALSVQTLISEIGTNVSKWPDDKHFASWLGLSPANRITGGKVLSTKTRKVNNRAATVFRLAALAIGKTKNSSLGAYYRRIRARVGAPKAITATARKLSCLFYNMLKHGGAYVEKGLSYYEKTYQEKIIQSLQRKAKALGYQLVNTV
jgi:transposase